MSLWSKMGMHMSKLSDVIATLEAPTVKLLTSHEFLYHPL